MSRFSERLGTTRQRETSAAGAAAKMTIRDNVLNAIGAEHARVFDLFCGSGKMFRAVWINAAFCAGCDTTFYADERIAYVADNRRVLRAVDLTGFNVFDCDAYSQPWEQVIIIAARRRLAPGELVGLIVTEGQSLALRFNSPGRALLQLAGVANVPGLQRRLDDMIDRALLRAAAQMGGKIISQWRAASQSGAAMRYVGIVMEGKDGAS